MSDIVFISSGRPEQGQRERKYRHNFWQSQFKGVCDRAFQQVILFQNIIEVLHRSIPAILLQSLLGFEPRDGRRIAGMLIGVDDPRRGMVLSAQGLNEKVAEALTLRPVPPAPSATSPERIPERSVEHSADPGLTAELTLP